MHTDDDSLRLDSASPLQYVRNRDEIFYSLPLQMHVVSVLDVPFVEDSERRVEENTRYVRRAIKKCFSEIATSAFCTRSPEITEKKN